MDLRPFERALPVLLSLVVHLLCVVHERRKKEISLRFPGLILLRAILKGDGVEPAATDSRLRYPFTGFSPRGRRQKSNMALCAVFSPCAILCYDKISPVE